MNWHALLLSFEIAALATCIAGVLGIVLGACMARARFWGRDLLDVLITAPMVLPPTVLGYYVLVSLGRASVLGRAYESVTGSSIVFTKTGAVIAATLAALPFVAKSARAAMEEVDVRLVGAAQTLGAAPLRVFFSILLPLSSRGVIAGLSLGFARALGDFGVTLMVAGNIPGFTQTASLAIYDAVLANRDAQAAGMAALMAALAIAILYATLKLTQKERSGF